eukprot:15430832-Alexandrium_andersonii.AAC.1
MPLAPREAQRLRRSALKLGGLRCSPIPSRGEGPLARWVCWDRGCFGLDFGLWATLGQKVGRCRSRC